MNAASPGVISAFLPNKFYKNDDEYLKIIKNYESKSMKKLPLMTFIYN